MGTQKRQGHFESLLLSVCVETNCYEDEPETNPTFFTGVVSVIKTMNIYRQQFNNTNIKQKYINRV